MKKNRYTHLLFLAKLIIYFVLFATAAVLFTRLTHEVLKGDTLPIDNQILLAINATSTPFWDQFFLFTTQLGDLPAVVTITSALIIALLARRRFHQAIVVAVSVAGIAGLSVILKLVFGRQRPDLWEQLISISSYAFPSAHAMVSAVLALVVIYLVWKSRFKWAIAAIAITYALLIAFSRLYLGVHYPTDIIGGWLLAGLWMGVVLLAVKAWSNRHKDSSEKIE